MIHSRTICLWTASLLIACAVRTPLAAQAKGDAYLKCDVNPGRTGVFVDGKYVGPAANFKIARKYALPAGPHEVKLVDPRYEEVTKMVTLVAGKTEVIAETMKPVTLAKGPFGILRTEYPDKFAADYVNDKFYGHSGEFDHGAQGLLLPPGKYTVRIEPVSGGNPISQSVTIEAEKRTVVK